MATGFNTSPYILPNMFAPPGQSLNNELNRRERQAERQYEIDWRNQRQQEADDWRKLQLIQELTNIDKYQTGEATADALGYQKSQEMLQRFTAMASGMSPQELQYKISQEMGNTAGAMKSLKDELVLSDVAIKQIKELYPDIDAERLTKAYRADVINRRIQNGEFRNPTLIEQSKINFNNPETIAEFIGTDTNQIIKEEILNPKIYEEGSVMQGNRDANTTYKSRLSPFVKSNIKETDFTPEGMLKNNVRPKTDFNFEREDLFGQPMETLSKDAYETGFSKRAKLAFLAMAKRGIPQWKNMAADDKDKAIRNLAAGYVRQLDKSGYSTTAASPPASRSYNNINMPGSGGGNFRDSYNRILKESNNPNRPNKSIPINELSSEDADVVVAAANRKDPSSGFNYSNIFVKQDKDGVLRIYKAEDGELITALTEGGVNVDANKPFGVNERRQAEAASKTETPKPTGKQITYKGLDKNGNPIFE